MNVGGIVLCGGQSIRMGSPKAWLPFAGELMLPRVVRLLSEVVRPIVVVAAPEQDVPALPEWVRVVRDELKGRGPLQGLAAGLTALRGQVDAAYLSSCDAPFLRPAFVRRMIHLIGNHDICILRIGEFHHPLAAVYRMGVAEAVARLMGDERAGVVRLTTIVPTCVVDPSELAEVDPTLQSLRNLNTREEYQAALRDVEAARGGNES